MNSEEFELEEENGGDRRNNSGLLSFHNLRDSNRLFTPGLRSHRESQEGALLRHNLSAMQEYGTGGFQDKSFDHLDRVRNLRSLRSHSSVQRNSQLFGDSS